MTDQASESDASIPGPSIEAYCGGLFQTNGYLLRLGETRYLFDAPEGAADWVAGRTDTLDGLILTHQHHDHVVDAAAIQQRFGCPLHAHSRPDEDLILTRRLEQMTGLPFSIDEYRINHLLEDTPSLSLGGKPGAELNLTVLQVPGHSPDSLCFHFELDGQSVLFGGDVLFRRGIGRTDFPHGNHEQLLSGIREKLWPLPDGTTVLPGHGPGTTIGEEKAENPFL